MARPIVHHFIETHFDQFLEFNGLLCRGKQYQTGPTTNVFCDESSAAAAAPDAAARADAADAVDAVRAEAADGFTAGSPGDEMRETLPRVPGCIRLSPCPPLPGDETDVLLVAGRGEAAEDGLVAGRPGNETELLFGVVDALTSRNPGDDILPVRRAESDDDESGERSTVVQAAIAAAWSACAALWSHRAQPLAALCPQTAQPLVALAAAFHLFAALASASSSSAASANARARCGSSGRIGSDIRGSSLPPLQRRRVT